MLLGPGPPFVLSGDHDSLAAGQVAQVPGTPFESQYLKVEHAVARPTFRFGVSGLS